MRSTACSSTELAGRRLSCGLKECRKRAPAENFRLACSLSSKTEEEWWAWQGLNLRPLRRQHKLTLPTCFRLAAFADAEVGFGEPSRGSLTTSAPLEPAKLRRWRDRHRIDRATFYAVPFPSFRIDSNPSLPAWDRDYFALYTRLFT